MKEEQIRKTEAFNKYLKQAAEDAKSYFRDRSEFVPVGCPACGSLRQRFEFDKHDFKYVSCDECATLFVNPRPPKDRLNDFYANSPSTHFWINEFFKPVAQARREKIFRPRAAYVDKMFSGKTLEVIGDIGSGFGIFLEELRLIRPGARFIAIEPSLEQAQICRSHEFEVCNCSLEEMSGYEGKFDLLTAFELFEHLCDPQLFMERVRAMLKPGGYFLFTTLNGMGFDIQLLWERSKSVHPPHHLNFFNPSSVLLLLKRSSLEPVEVSTPGVLDWDIVEGMIKNDGLRLGRFWDLLVEKCDAACKQGFQEWITRNLLSSHMRVLSRKKG